MTDTYAMVVLKDTPALGHLSNGKTGRYAKSVLYFLRGNPMNTASITVTEKKVNFGDTQGLQILCTILFMKEEKYIELKKKQWNLCPL